MPTALIFGTSRGLGRALAVAHLERGWQVIATVRDDKALAGLASDALTVETIDTTDWMAVDALRDRLVDRPLDLLFVSAAIVGPSAVPIGEVEPDAFAEMMLVNVLAPLRIADRYADLVTPDGMIAVMSSSLGSIALNLGCFASSERRQAFPQRKDGRIRSHRRLEVFTRFVDGALWKSVHHSQSRPSPSAIGRISISLGPAIGLGQRCTQATASSMSLTSHSQKPATSSRAFAKGPSATVRPGPSNVTRLPNAERLSPSAMRRMPASRSASLNLSIASIISLVSGSGKFPFSLSSVAFTNTITRMASLHLTECR